MTKKRQFVSQGNEKKLREGERLRKRDSRNLLKSESEIENLVSIQVRGRKLVSSLHSKDPEKNSELIIKDAADNKEKVNYTRNNYFNNCFEGNEQAEIIKIIGKAARDGNLSILEKYKNQLDILQSPDLLGRTPLHYGIAFNRGKVVRFLLASGVTVDPCDLLLETPLHYAAANKRHNYCPLLLEKGAKINASNKNGRTPLHIAARENNLCAIKTMLKYNTDVEVRDNIGYTPLQLACLEGALQVVEALFEKVNVNSDKLDSKKLLHLAVQSGNGDLVEYLLDQGLNINAQNESEKTPLHLAFLYFSFQRNYKRWLIIKLLLKRSADYTIRDQAGKIPADYLQQS